ncbi:MAG: hypothetical protein IJ449_12345 [Clostridia bacterium]|nr:hypothetical protein [Clostridia bacterium]
MNELKRTTMLLAAFLAVTAVMTACGDSGDSGTKDTTPAVTTEAVTETETEDPRIPSNLPEDLDLGGETINVWYFTKNSDAAERFLDLVGDPEGDIVEVALYERNLAIEEQLNMKFNYVDTGVISGEVGTEIRKVLMAGDTTYDLYSVIQWNSAALALEHCFLNLTDMPYLDLDQPWWSQYYMESLSIGEDNMYFLAGDISIDMVRTIASMYFNKNIYAELYDSADYLYEEVLSGAWTFDRMLEYTQEAYRDVNGDGTVNTGDRYGLITNSFNNMDAFSFGMGAQLTTRDADNLPVVTVGDEHNVDIYGKMYRMITETVGAVMNKEGTNPTLDNVQTFASGNALFLPGFLYTSENLRDMDNDYGIIPFPKYNTEQESYQSAVHDIATLMCLPTTCTKIDAVCATLEAMAYYSYYNVTPVYYETALKTKYTRDDLSSQIIDLIHDTSMTDLAYAYSSGFNNMGMIMRTLAAEKTEDYASYYAKREKSTLRAVEKFITNFEESAE